jgi:hypothetical protein
MLNIKTGKDLSLNSILAVFNPLLTLIEKERNKPIIDKAIKKALKKLMSQNNGVTVTEEDLEYDDYKEYLPQKPNLFVRGASTPGGISKSLSSFEKQSLGSPSVLMTEFGTEFIRGKNTEEVLLLLAELYDMGRYTPPEYKTDEVKEVPIVGQYTNFLGHTSPKILLADNMSKQKTLQLFQMYYARRCFLTAPDEVETYENDIIPKTYDLAKELILKNRKVLTDYSIELEGLMLQRFKPLIHSPELRSIKFSEKAALLYDDYKMYCELKSELIEDSSIVQLEVKGRAFKTARIAAMWAYTEGNKEITLDILKSAIYYAEYNSRYLVKFEKKLTAKAFVLLADYLTTTNNTLSLDSAITNGYVGRVTESFKEVLEPINSYLRSQGVAEYCSESKSFIYTPFQRTEDSKGNWVSINKVDGISKADREYHLGSFQTSLTVTKFSSLLKLMKSDRIYSFFKYKDNKRSQANIESDTSIISIDVDKSEVDMQVLHSYLEDYKHIISTTSNRDNMRKFRILIFTNIYLVGEPKEYSYVVKRICSDLLIEADPVSFNPSQPMYSYLDSNVLYKEEGELWDIREYIADFKSEKKDEPNLPVKPMTPQARKSAITKIMNDVSKVFNYAIEAPEGKGSLMLARASLHMLDLEFSKQNYLEVINYINSSWDKPMDKDRFERTIINQYISKFKD